MIPNHLTCPEGSKFCSMKSQHVSDTSFTHPSTEHEWTRNAPMGRVLRNPRVIPPMKNTSDQCNQTNVPVKATVVVPKNSVIARDYDVNPRLKTTYQHYFNGTADALLGYCDNRTFAQRISYFRNCQRAQDELLFAMKNGMYSIPKYRSDYNKRISEYMAEISFVGAKIIKSRIHDHSKCGPSSRKCVHYMDF